MVQIGEPQTQANLLEWFLYAGFRKVPMQQSPIQVPKGTYLERRDSKVLIDSTGKYAHWKDGEDINRIKLF